MLDQLKTRLASLLSRPRPMKPQTERQLAGQLAEHSSNLSGFLLCAADVLEDHEIDILFASIFTPTLDERAELADLLFHWRPTAGELQQIIDEMPKTVPFAKIKLPDGTDANLTLHEVMADRFVKLLRLDSGPDAATAAALRDALPAELWPIAVALLCERGMTAEHQHWFAAFVNHVRSHRMITRGFLQTTAEFIAGQKDLAKEKVLAAAEALMRATESTAAYTSGGHNYWSPDVAQHHQYRGQGRIDKELVEQRQAEVGFVTALVEDLKSFDPH